MYVPTIGDEITLASAWTFGLYYEYRNEAMINFTFPGAQFVWRDMVLPSGEKPSYGSKIADVELPLGAVLKVDRIYIRKGGPMMKEFDSVSFILQSIPKKELAIEQIRDNYVQDGLDNKGHVKWKIEKKVTIRKKARFWAKLRDVNRIEFYMGREDIEEEEKPIVRRVIRF